MQINYSVPVTKNDLTVDQYLRISKLHKEAETNESDIDQDKLLSIALNLSEKVLAQLPIEDYKEALRCVAECLNKDSVLHLTFHFNGVKYGFIPKLEDITAGEYSAIDTFLKDADKNACKLLNVLYRPIKKETFYKSLFSKKKEGKYTIQPYNKDNDTSVFYTAPYEIYESALVFFFNLGKDLSNAILKCTKEMEQQMIGQQGLVKNGDGIKRLTHTLQQNVSELNRYNTNLSIKYCKD